MNRFVTAAFRMLIAAGSLGSLPLLIIVVHGWDEFVGWITAVEMS